MTISKLTKVWAALNRTPDITDEELFAMHALTEKLGYYFDADDCEFEKLPPALTDVRGRAELGSIQQFAD